ncbi:hypothetical protein F4804DRAFT_6377 [Jackrogersella minutella]|nr:hypothetical protein F4804DRAFT_6377 [Jackrogersella minutella]
MPPPSRCLGEKEKRKPRKKLKREKSKKKKRGFILWAHAHHYVFGFYHQPIPIPPSPFHLSCVRFANGYFCYFYPGTSYSGILSSVRSLVISPVSPNCLRQPSYHGLVSHSSHIHGHSSAAASRTLDGLGHSRPFSTLTWSTWCTSKIRGHRCLPLVFHYPRPLVSSNATSSRIHPLRFGVPWP